MYLGMSNAFLKNRTKETFLERIQVKSLGTKKGYESALVNFADYCVEQYDQSDIDEVIKEILVLKDLEREQAVYDVLQGWVNWNKASNRGSATIKSYFSRVRTYFHYKGIKITDQESKENIVFPRLVKEELHGLSLDEIKLVLDNANPVKKALYLTLLSSGMRIGEALQLRKRDIDTSQERIKLRIQAGYSKTSTGRTTFVSKEASGFLLTKLRGLDDGDLVFGKHENIQFAVTNEIQIFQHACNRAGLDTKYQSNKRRMITLHSFRAYFITKVSRKDPNFAKRLAGQKGYLLEYDRMNDKEKLDLYLQIEPSLFVYSQVIEKDDKDQRIDNLYEIVSELAKRLDAKS